MRHVIDLGVSRGHLTLELDNLQDTCHCGRCEWDDCAGVGRKRWSG